MFSNNLSFSNIDEHQTPERTLKNCLPNITPHHEANNRVSQIPGVETDLIDLLDDLSISSKPNEEKENNIDDLQIKELEKFLSNSGSSKLQKTSLTAEQEKQYQRFFDKYERKAKEGNIVNKAENNSKALGFYNCLDPNYIGTPKVLIPKIYQDVQEPNEDLTEEVLLEKNLERQHLSKLANLLKVNNEMINSKNNKITSPLIKKDGVEKNDIRDEIVASNNIPLMSSKVKNKDSFVTTNYNLYRKQDTPKQNLNISIEELVTKYNLTYLDVIEMDDKLSKQSTLKTEAEKVHLTPGPTLHYKSVVLPQIMKRLTEKKKTLDEQANINTKLVLDTSSKPIKDNVILQNKSSVKSNNFAADAHFEIRDNNLYHGSIKKSQLPTSFNITSEINLRPESAGTKNTDESKLNRNSCASGIQNDGNYRDSRFLHINELKALKTEKILAEKSQDAVRDVINVLRPPQSLMVDCNKERFVANATTQLINDFVYGKF